MPVRGRSRPLRVLAEQTLLPVAAARAGVDLLHNIFTTAPALVTVPQVSTVHDVIYKRVPETHAGVMTHGMHALTIVAVRRSERVLTVSYAAGDDLVEFLGVPRDRIDVTQLGPGIRSVDGATGGERALRREFGLGDARILLSVSAKRAHKNLDRLIDAVAALPPERDVRLVIPGYATAFERELQRRAEERGASDRVRFAGWVDDATLERLYRAADAFVFPSLAEGFGLPVLEAMARGTPVACSDRTSIPEVGGDAVLYFDPEDTAAIGAAIERLLDDEELRERLARAGPLRAAEFSWERTAAGTLASYERALEAS
jgi:glycosyltransferase involved in cell wall biosynthesis